MANHELYVVQGKTLDNIAGTMRAVLGVDKDALIRFDEVANSDKTEQINADVETQANLIAQIKTALDGKASGGGGTEEALKSLFFNTLTEINIAESFELGTKRVSCSSLVRWSTPNLTGKLAGFSFYGCVNIQHIDLGKITGFGTNDIGGCHKITSIILRKADGVVPLGSAFANCNSILREDYAYYCHFYVPKALIEEYKVATNWSNYANRFRAIEDYPEITGGVL